MPRPFVPTHEITVPGDRSRLTFPVMLDQGDLWQRSEWERHAQFPMWRLVDGNLEYRHGVRPAGAAVSELHKTGGAVVTAPREVTAADLTDEEIRAWEKSEIVRLASPGLRRKVGALSAAALGQSKGIELTKSDPADVRNAARARICDAINARSKGA